MDPASAYRTSLGRLVLSLFTTCSRTTFSARRFAGGKETHTRAGSTLLLRSTNHMPLPSGPLITDQWSMQRTRASIVNCTRLNIMDVNNTAASDFLVSNFHVHESHNIATTGSCRVPMQAHCCRRTGFHEWRVGGMRARLKK